ncbi:hypothetical protein [Xenorhabdus griffiniae]|uniref:Phage protein n=1 Tax=Xenorhabdus griffiniae TaxID=351672 RepID=A0ABY9XEU4_9GAMM|nr:hypothetical protein [Xenorhabdus griffiniae]MBD1225993.1 hypothetical protein [Xenorhabdus griffiniae]MBE8585889.1 hypothetical protein [Xenorhabdus griffiniae]WMV71433.1 hypothetical protein QL128_14830 [Xenorhabdus griffiniae]WNH01110.1 hypothetical protein QL112_014835 [Xenorhabdus griffiniae]
MSEKIKVVISAEARVHFRKIVEMDVTDYDKYWELLDSNKRNSEIDSELAGIVYKYGFDTHADRIEDNDELGEIQFDAVDE